MSVWVLMAFMAVGVPILLIVAMLFPQRFYEALLFFYEPGTRLPFLVLVAVWFWYKTLYKRHKPHRYDFLVTPDFTEAEAEGVRYHYSLYAVESNPPVLTVHLLSLCGYDFTLRPERPLTRWLRRWRLLHECQSGDEAFDEAVFVESDDEALCRCFREKPRLRESVLAIWREAEAAGFASKFLRQFDGRMVLTLEGRQKADASTEVKGKALAGRCAVWMRRLADGLPDRGPANSYTYRESSSRAVAVVTLLFAILLFNGAIKLFLELPALFYVPRLEEADAFVGPAIAVTLLAVAAYALFAFFYFRKSARLAQALWLGVSLGAVGIFLTALTGLKEADVYLDTSSRQVRLEKVLDKKVIRGRSVRYKLRLQSLGEVKVPSGLYRRFTVGEQVCVVVRKGYLGVAWIEAILPPNVGICAQKGYVAHGLKSER